MTDIHSCSYFCDRPECIKAQRDELRERLAQPEQEPVARVIDGVLVKSELPEKYTGHLYTTPPQRKPLKLREIEKCIYDANNDPIVACRNVEAAHGIKGEA